MTGSEFRQSIIIADLENAYTNACMENDQDTMARITRALQAFKQEQDTEDNISQDKATCGDCTFYSSADGWCSNYYNNALGQKFCLPTAPSCVLFVRKIPIIHFKHTSHTERTSND